MSLASLNGTFTDVVFGGEVIVDGDVNVSGDLVVNGTINGFSAQGQDTNNTWTGTNEYTVYRPTTVNADPDVSTSGAVPKQQLDEIIDGNSTLQNANTWSGLNTFTGDVSATGTNVAANTTELANGAYLLEQPTTFFGAYPDLPEYITSAKTFSGTVTFSGGLSINDEPTNGTDVATVGYFNENVLIPDAPLAVKAKTFVGKKNSSGLYEVDNTSDYGFTSGTKICIIQAIASGGGGSATGYSGGAGANGTLVVLGGDDSSGDPYADWTIKYTGASGGKGGTSDDTAGKDGKVQFAQVYPNNVGYVGNGENGGQRLGCNGGKGATASAGGDGGDVGIVYYENNPTDTVSPIGKSENVKGSKSTQINYDITAVASENNSTGDVRYYGAGGKGSSGGESGGQGGSTLLTYTLLLS